MESPLAILIINSVLTPVLVLITLWVKAMLTSKEQTFLREGGYINNLEKRLGTLEKEIKEVRAELKNRDKEYLVLYQDYTTLKAKHEVLVADHDDLRKQYNATAVELATLKEDIKKKAEEAALAMKTI